MTLYECTFVTRPEATNTDIDKIADELVNIVKQEGGRQVKREYWGLRTLAYRVEKHNKGHYLYLGLEANAAAVKEIDRKLRYNEGIIRHLIVSVPAISKDPSAMLRKDEDDSQNEGFAA